MSFANLESPASSSLVNYEVTLDHVFPGIKTFDVIYINKLGATTTFPIQYTVIWRATNGPEYWPRQIDSTEVENVDAFIYTCVLTKITTCVDSNDYLRVIKFDFTGTGCAQITKLYNSSDTECNTAT